VAEAADQAHAVQLAGALFEAADQQHVLIEFQKLVLADEGVDTGVIAFPSEASPLRVRAIQISLANLHRGLLLDAHPPK
jgi:hypothetical protein